MRYSSKPVLKKELFPDPVIIDTLELLRLRNTFLCRVRSKDGAEGISVANNEQMKSLWPVFVNRLQPFFHRERCPGRLKYFWKRFTSTRAIIKCRTWLSGFLWLQLNLQFSTCLGRISGKSLGQLIGEIHNREIAVYQANGERGITAELTIEHLIKEVGETKAKALKFKVGGRMSNNYESPAGRTEKLIPLVEKPLAIKWLFMLIQMVHTQQMKQ